MSMTEQVSVEEGAESFEQMLRSGTAWSYGKFIFNLLRILYTGFHSGASSLQSHQQWVGRRAPLTPHPLQHLLWVALLIFIILTGVRWNLKVALILISLIA